ncbi:MAG TPA: AMP-binding protein, partial [Thermoleophilaceae bacterium]
MRLRRRSAGTLYELLAGRARRDPGAPALLGPGREPLGFGQLVALLDELGEELARLGIGRGARVATLAPPGAETAVAVLAVACHATCVPLDPRLTAGECEGALRQTGAVALLGPEGGESAAWSVARELGLATIAWSAPGGAAAGHIRLHGAPVSDRARAERAQPGDVALLLRTSGTAAAPRIVPVEQRTVVARAGKAARMLGLRADDRCLGLMPLCYAHGLHSALIGPLAAGGSAICPPGFGREAFLGCLTGLEPTWYTAGATHQLAIAGWLRERPEAVAGHRLRFVRSSAAPLDPRVRDELEEALGVPVVQAYGTSETGPVAANPPEGPIKHGTVGVSPDGDVAVADEDGALLGPGAEGEVVVRGATVFAGYLDDPDATRAAFRDDWFRTGDLGSLDADGYLTLSGRLKDVINRGGEKVSPLEIDRRLLEHPQVEEAAAFGVPHPRLGEDVAVAVRLRPDARVEERELRRFLLERLTTFKVPRRIVVVDEIPKGPTGKPLRGALGERLGTGALPGGPHAGNGAAPEAPAVGAIENTLARLWRAALGREDVGPGDDFFQLGGDSLIAVELLAAVERELHVRLPLASLIEFPTIRAMARGLERPGWLDEHATLTGDTIGVNRGGAAAPLFGVCGRYGHAFRLLLVGRELGEEQPFYGLQPPGMDWEAAGCRTIEEMAANYVARVVELQPRGPYRLMGTSFGGLVVFEMARQLQRAGEEVELLAMVDTSAPGSYGVDDGSAPPGRAIEAAGERVAEAHMAARRAYSIGGRFDGELVYLYCSGTPVPAGGDPRRAWMDAASEGTRLLRLPGLHGTFHLEPQFSALCAGLRACLEGERP